MFARYDPILSLIASCDDPVAPLQSVCVEAADPHANASLESALCVECVLLNPRVDYFGVDASPSDEPRACKVFTCCRFFGEDSCGYEYCNVGRGCHTPK